jgi:hypothetical protein
MEQQLKPIQIGEETLFFHILCDGLMSIIYKTKNKTYYTFAQNEKCSICWANYDNEKVTHRLYNPFTTACDCLEMYNFFSKNIKNILIEQTWWLNIEVIKIYRNESNSYNIYIFTYNFFNKLNYIFYKIFIKLFVNQNPKLLCIGFMFGIPENTMYEQYKKYPSSKISLNSLNTCLSFLE